jgi:hypothetical protein
MIAKITDHVAQGLDRLISLYQAAVNIPKIITILLEEVQVFEDLAYDVYLALLLDTSFGDALNRLGKLVGASRRGLADATFKEIIRITDNANTGRGFPEQIAFVATSLTGADSTQYVQAGTANYRLNIYISAPIDPAIIDIFNEIMLLMRPSGVGLGDIVEVESDSFIFDDATRGFDNGLLPRRLDL